MNELKFSIVREDSQTEIDLIESSNLGDGAMLCVVSGGCTLFDVKSTFGDMEVVGFDVNPFQIAHAKNKLERIASGDWSHVPEGAFEHLFRLFRYVIGEFVATPSEIERFFSGETDITQTWFESPYWGVAFKQAFHPDFLVAMFGPSAVQHARRPYASYFREHFEAALQRPNAHRNRFLQHIFTGDFFEDDRPVYMKNIAELSIDLIEGAIEQIPNIDRFDLVSVSNVFDWSDDLAVEAWSDSLVQLKKGALLLIRQLNNDRDLARFFPQFEFDETRGDALLDRDESFFYERILVGTRQ